MNNATMLYKCPGPHTTDGISYDYVIVDEPEIAAQLAEGWHLTYVEADAARTSAAGELAANKAELAEVERQLEGAGSLVGAQDTAAGAETQPVLRAVHKGAGKWSLLDANDNEVRTGLTKDEAKAAVGE